MAEQAVKTSCPRFGHSESLLAFWRKLGRQVTRLVPTPFYLFSPDPIASALGELDLLQRKLPIPCRHWLSCKTQPLRPLLSWWRRQGRGVEVVSEFEFRAALQEGFPPDDILVNGPAKHRWLARHAVPGIRVNFDSAADLKALLPLAQKLDWSVGVRCQTREECDPEHPGEPTQFGMPENEAVTALRLLRRSKVRLETVHFHLRTNVTSATFYERALQEVIEICHVAGFGPKYLDCGGGFPAPHVLGHDGHAYNSGFDWGRLAKVYAAAIARLPGLKELWLENGRFLSARSGVLVVKVLEIKKRGPRRYLICDGGRTMNALVSQWEEHALLPLPDRRGPVAPTLVCGPTCMAFDRLGRFLLPANLAVGDHLIWMDAGAYHLPWETRFSHGSAAVVWHERGRATLVREPESFETWWGQWKATSC